MKGQITIYTIIGCPHCLHAKNTLKELDLQYVEVSIDKYSKETTHWLKDKIGKSSVPQIFFNDTYIGGNDELQNIVNDAEKWKDLLQTLENDYAEGMVYIPTSSDETIDSECTFTCTPDPKADIVNELINSGIPQKIRAKWFCPKIENAFSGKDFLQWYSQIKEVTLDEAISEGNDLLKKKFILPINDNDSFEQIEDDAKVFYRLNVSLDDDALNAGTTQNCEIENANELAEIIRKLILQLFNDFISPEGYVDYKAMKDSDIFTEYTKIVKELQRISVERMTEVERKVFFINIYNSLVIHATILNGPPTNWRARFKFFGGMKYIIGGYLYSLDDIENGILRANKKGAAHFFPQFAKNDHRKVVSLSQVDPRIHFALNCGAKSCPPIKTFSVENIDEELTLTTASYLENDEGIKISPCTEGNATIYLTSLLKWYSSDFGNSDKEALEWVEKHLQDEEKKILLNKVLEDGNWKIVYNSYDWSTNAKD